ncbi:MAG TPA: lamin tail domain-containing protein, partial [Capillimicrobium sp.]
SSRSGQRLRRSVAVRDGGRWRDLGTRLVAEGHALWLPAHVESHFNRRYAALAQRARLRGLRLYDPDGCGAGPSPGAQLRLWVNWDADSADGRNLDDEWVRIKNEDLARPVSVGRWVVRDSDLRQLRLPRRATIAPGGVITVRVGPGRDTRTEFHWGLRAPAFENVERGLRMGDGAYLFDPRGNLRASMIYPCTVGCADPLRGRVTVSAQPAASPETLSVRNVGDGVVDLHGYVLRSFPRSYHFPAGTLIAPGDALRLVVGGSPAGNQPLRKHWPVKGPILKNKGAAVRLETYARTVIDCFSWGRGRC